MALDEDVREIKHDVQAINRNKPGFIALTLLGTWFYVLGDCNNSDQTDKITQAIANSPQVHTANVLGAEAPENCDTRDLFGANDPETFCDVSGKRYFLEIDGKPVAEYLKGRQ